VKAAIFDMDGLLIDSEPLWQEAEMRVFNALGVPLTREMCAQSRGVRLDDVVRHWYGQFPWQGPTLAETEARIIDVVSGLIVQRGRPMPGVQQAIGMLAGAGYTLAVASSSPLGLIRTALETFGMIDRFTVLHSAEHEPAGKPDPAVYLSTMAKIGAAPGDCIAFEDSVHGVLAAKRAGAMVFAVPDPAEAGHAGFAEADVVLDTLLDFSLSQLG